jgi:alpha-glucosidase (family GH31 glycosyl hydrolase)
MVIIVDVGIGGEDPSDLVLDKALEYKILLKLLDSQYLIGRVWPGLSVFPDLLHPNINHYY